MLRTFRAKPVKWQGQMSLQPPKATRIFRMREINSFHKILKTNKGKKMKSALLVLLLVTGLFAKEAILPTELLAWKSLLFVNTAKSKNELSDASLTLNKASYVGLINTPKIQYVTRPTNEGGTVSYGGLFQIEIKESGTYRVVLGNASWIDLLKDGKPAQSVAHAQGPENSGIRKMVDYPLETGIYTLQLSAGADSTTAVLITKIK
jgi:hypothetical protein